MQYLTYEEYLNMGGTLDKTAFERFSYRAKGIIDNATHNRITGEIKEEIKNCFIAVVDYLSTNERRGAEVTSRSQSAGNVSESESYSVLTLDDKKAELEQIILDYLGSVEDEHGRPILYRGAQY